MSAVNEFEATHENGKGDQQVIADLARLSLSAITIADLGERYTVADDGTLIVKVSEQDFDSYQAILAADD